MQSILEAHLFDSLEQAQEAIETNINSRYNVY